MEIKPVPTLVLYTERFQQPQDVKRIKEITDFVEGSKSAVLEGAGHMDQTDMTALGVDARALGLIVPKRFKKLIDLQQSKNPLTILHQNNEQILGFLKSL
jgi:hypothetical protein